MVKLKIKKGDKVVVISGKDKGKMGDVLKTFPQNNKILVTGVNQVKKHTKASKTSQGGIVAKGLPIHMSNVAYLNSKTNKAAKIGYKILEDGTKKRFIKSSGEIIE